MTIAVGVLFLVLVNTITGVHSINPVLLKAARDLGASRLQIFIKVILPGALPNIFTGLRLGAGMALILVFITEIEATKAGLGFLLWEAFQLHGYAARLRGRGNVRPAGRGDDVAAPVAGAGHLPLDPTLRTRQRGWTWAQDLPGAISTASSADKPDDLRDRLEGGGPCLRDHGARREARARAARRRPVIIFERVLRQAGSR